jgi:ADP-ribosylglycohydrolase
MLERGDNDRRLGAIVGQFLGDALCLGSHWYYDFARREADFPDGPQGFDEPVQDRYHFGRKSGDQTHYGEAAMVLLESIATAGRFDYRDYGRRFAGYFGDPQYRGYLDKATKGTLAAFDDSASFDFQKGADDKQSGTFSRLAPLVAAHVDDPGLDLLIERAVRVTQDRDDAVANCIAHGRILESLIKGDDLSKALDGAIGHLRTNEHEVLRQHLAEARHQIDDPVVEVTAGFGRACNLHQTFPSTLHALIRHRDDVKTCLLEIMRAGGDNAARASAAGAWLGALHGFSDLPQDWINRLRAKTPIIDLAKTLIDGVSV